MSEPIKNSHCGYCGSKFTEQVAWPRKCFVCYNDSYCNPLPVVVVNIPVQEDFPDGTSRVGLLIQKRDINPKKGQWALTGGYVDYCETWKHAAVREVFEELGFVSKEDDYNLYEVESSVDQSSLLIICTCSVGLYLNELDKFVPNSEVSEIGVMWEDTKLAFPAHTKAANEVLAILKGVCNGI